MSSGALDRLAAGKYVSLTTFRRDGTPVPTPVWLVRDDDRLLVTTEASSGKAKRIRNNADVLVAPCDVRGRLLGDAVPARATLQTAEHSARTADLIRRRYGLMGRLFMMRGRPENRVGITIELT